MADTLKQINIRHILNDVSPEEPELQQKIKRKFTPREFTRSLKFVLPNIFEFKRPDIPPKYFAIDIDKTFYHTDESIFSKNTQAFLNVRRLGYEPFMCTGRPLEVLPYLFGDNFFKITGYHGFPGIYLNGTIIYDKHGNLIDLVSFSKDFVEEVIELIQENGLEDSFLFWGVNGHYSLKNLNDQVDFLLSSDDVPTTDIVTPKELLELDIVSMVTSSKIDIKKAVLGKDYSIRNIGFEYLIEYCPRSVNKADAISTLMNHENLDPKSCGFIGDGDNDIEVMDLCDLSFAVANATNLVKKHAKWILHLNYYDGAFSYVMDLVYKIRHF